MQKVLLLCLFFFVLPGSLIAETLTDNFDDNSLIPCYGHLSIWAAVILVFLFSVSEINGPV